MVERAVLEMVDGYGRGGGDGRGGDEDDGVDVVSFVDGGRRS